MFGLKIGVNGEVVSLVGAKNAFELWVTVVAHPNHEASALLWVHGSTVETSEYRTTREWVEPRRLESGDTVSVQVADVAAPDEGKVIAEFGRKVVGERSELFCSWCGKSEHAVKKLVAGPQVGICDECVALINEIVGESAT